MGIPCSRQMEMITILSVDSVSGMISMHSFSLVLSRSMVDLVMDLGSINLSFSTSEQALATTLKSKRKRKSKVLNYENFAFF